MVKDMYADLEKIEARGKRKKEKSKGLFSSFGNKDAPEPDEAVTPTQDVKPEPAPAPAIAEPRKAAPAPPAQPEPKPATSAHVQQPSPVKPAAQPSQPVHVSHQPEPSWQPPVGAKLRKAEEELVEYKKWLNKGYKSGMMTKEQCVAMVKKKEIELGLRPSE